jgi:hypothetical protein
MELSMTKFVSLSVALILLVAPAVAQDAAIVFAALDADRNGQISQTEAQKNVAVTQNFAQADTNLDGALSRAEFEAAFGRPQPPAGG